LAAFFIRFRPFSAASSPEPGSHGISRQSHQPLKSRFILHGRVAIAHAGTFIKPIKPNLPSMYFNLFIFGSFVAIASLIWRSFLNDFPIFRERLRNRLLFLIRKPLFCGFCFTSWTAFFTAIFFRPFPELNFFVGWFAIDTIALLIRSILIVLEEFICWETHTLNGRPNDVH
jgi:hypothetical protein